MQFVVIMREKKGKNSVKLETKIFYLLKGNTCKTGKGIQLSPT